MKHFFPAKIRFFPLIFRIKTLKRVIHNKFIMEYLRISKLLCTFVIELRNMFNQLNFQAMHDDLEKEIERKKKEIKDFLRVVKFTGLSQKEIEKRLDYLLDDLSRLMKKK